MRVQPVGSKTQQQFRDKNSPKRAIDIATGRLKVIKDRNFISQGFYGDFSEPDDFHSMQRRVFEAKQKFEMLPWELKKYLNNDPANMIDLVNRMAAGEQEAIDIGVEYRLIPERYHSNSQKSETKAQKLRAELVDSIVNHMENVVKNAEKTKVEVD